MSQNIPKTVDVDDLVWELGKNAVERINAEKYVKKLEQDRLDVAVSQKNAEALQKSNDALAQKNFELAECLKNERREKRGLQERVATLEKEMARREKISKALKDRNSKKNA